jgi:hypothetical protein
VRETAAWFRVSGDKIRHWIKTGQLGAINTATSLCGRPRFVILPHHLAAFERSRDASPPPKPVRKRQKRLSFVDYYPES